MRFTWGKSVASYPTFIIFCLIDKVEKSLCDACRVLIADDHELFVEGLVSTLEAQQRKFNIVGVASNGAELPGLIDAVDPNLAVQETRHMLKRSKTFFWAFHGRSDPNFPVRYTRDIIKAIKQAVGNPKYT